MKANYERLKKDLLFEQEQVEAEEKSSPAVVLPKEQETRPGPQIPVLGIPLSMSQKRRRNF